MAPSWDPRATLDVYPKDSNFTCVGTTRRGLRCRNSFIQKICLAEADNILNTLPELEEFHFNAANLLPKLKKLAWLTLCPRWHQTRIPQVDDLAEEWLRVIQSLYRSPSSRSQLSSTIPEPRHRASSAHTSEGATASAISPAASRVRDHRGSRHIRLDPLLSTAAPDAIRRGHRHIAHSTTTAPTGTSNSPYTIQINLNIAVSTQRERGISGSRREFGQSSSPRQSHIAPSLAFDSHSNTERGDTRSSRSSTNSLRVPNTINLNANNTSLDAILSILESLAERSAPRSSNSSTLTSSRASHDPRSPTLSVTSNVSYIPPLGPAGFFSPPQSPMPAHPSGSLSISTDSAPQSPLIAPWQIINTTSSSGAASPIVMSPPLSPVLGPNAASPPAHQFAPPPAHAPIVRRRPLQDCYVCYEPIHRFEDGTWCRGSCGNNLHIDCFEEWSLNQGQYRPIVECGFCRAPWLF